mmetsp:Transcript_16292/g.45384  ORF Transcript_16292/g.45384 Transcript_16292/m.45384 type:complete len:838 (+) Transcript_16292:551-3064(+)|eukprot:CAMPEP_0117674452 /NCGR_PEP_ID=MMETSP0804-20121206/15046_1 /TAXON_ID=1074897 /ORGANISM="Tetraselmis astigmatica, Strain CCMP880" /LENGTH=837 /DNA_ID=CAMNT_0005483323 /DNA_START=526 /DNA_END=3039 /DNA_ORIENTATION=+
MCGMSLQKLEKMFPPGKDMPPQLYLLKMCAAVASDSYSDAQLALLELAAHPEAEQTTVGFAICSMVRFLEECSVNAGGGDIQQDLLGTIRTAAEMLPDRPVGPCRPPTPPKGAVSAEVAVMICGVILEQVKGLPDSLDEVAVELARRVHVPRAASNRRRGLKGTEGNQGPGETQEDSCGSLATLHTILWNKGTRCFSAKQYTQSERIFWMLGEKGLPLEGGSPPPSTIGEGGGGGGRGAGPTATPSQLPSVAKAWCVAAVCCLGQQKPHRALEALQRAEELEPGQSHCAFVRLKARFLMKDAAAAKAEVERLTECRDFEPGYLRIAVAEARRCSMDSVSIKALHSLQQSLEKGQQPAKGELLTEGEVIRALIKLGIAELRKAQSAVGLKDPRALFKQPLPSLSLLPANSKEKKAPRDMEPGPAEEACEAKDFARDALAGVVDEIGELFKLARSRFQQLGAAVFFGPDETTAKAQALWFSDTAWNVARETLAMSQAVGSPVFWQGSAVIWHSAMPFLQHTCAFVDSTPAHLHQCIMGALLGTLSALEAFDGLKQQQARAAAAPGGGVSRAETSTAVRNGSLTIARHLLSVGEEHTAKEQQLAERAAGGVAAAACHGGSKEAWLHYLAFRLEACQESPNTVSLTVMLRRAVSLPGMTSSTLSLYSAICMSADVGSGQHALAVTSLQMLLQKLVEEISQAPAGCPVSESTATLLYRTLRKLVQLSSSETEKLMLFRQAADLLSTNRAALHNQLPPPQQAFSSDLQWLVVASHNQGVVLAQHGRMKEAEAYLQAAVALQDATCALPSQEAAIQRNLRNVQQAVMATAAAEVYGRTAEQPGD